ncbi:hypothetical protein [Arcobacter caeni]|uniref:Uncharacterized protein n=1 Tax=Arcobacter caeni TaxID=1912877 RepID=A0A363CWK3_9BACT|nr:hypothetical protein [Arcobacter caeni]PUE63441.1 hypothetical protein B0174_11130 [Arcobacter caeni]
MEYFRELFFCIVIFFIGYLIFKYDVSKRLIRTRILEKDFKGCYIFRYPNRVEFHNKGQTYLIDFEDFFKQNPKLKGKIKIIDRPLLDVTNHEAIQKELEFRKEFRKKNEDI